MIKSYCISGDSWGCGEWRPYETNFPGGKQYDLQRQLLAFNNIVGDISLPGEHNPYTIRRLKEYIEHSPVEFDYVIWFQSDPLRRPEFIDVLKSAKEFSLDYNFFIETSNRYLDDDYHKLNSIGKPIYCIGGISKLNVDLMSQYPNLIPFVESFPEFLYPNRLHPALCVGEWMQHIERQVKLDALDKIQQDHANMMRWATDEYSEFFNVGDSHPNTQAYNLLSNYIMNNIGRVAESGLLHQS